MNAVRRAGGLPPGDHIRTESAPPAVVPLAFFLVATAALVTALSVGVLHPEEFLRHWAHNRTVLTVLHLFVLGWGTTLAMGAVYQMAPVVLHGRLHSGRLAFLQFAVHAAGFVSLVSGFWWVRPQWVVAGALTVVSPVLLFVSGMALTLRAAPYRHRVGKGMALAAGYLVLTAFWGLTLALSLRYGWVLPLGRVITTHLILGAGGWFSVLIVFVSLKLTPFFAAGKPPPPRLATPVLLTIALVPGALAASVTVGPPVRPAPLVVGLAAVGALAAAGYAALLWNTAPHRRGRREPPVRFALVGAVLFAAASLLGALAYGVGLAAFTRPAGVMAYAYLVLTGWVGTMTIGQLYRILPFVIWLERFRRRTPGEQLPFLHEIADRRIGDGILVLWLLASLLGTLALWAGWRPLLQGALATGLGASLLLAYAEARAFTVWRSRVRWPALPPFPVTRTGGAGVRRAGGPAGRRPAR